MQRDKRAHRTFGDIFGRVSFSDFAAWKIFVGSSMFGWLAFVVLCVVITCVMTLSVSRIPKRIVVGSIAQHDIRADRDYEIVDTDATNKFKEVAVDAVPNVYVFDPDLAKKIGKTISDAFERMRDKVASGEDPKGLRTEFESELNTAIGDKVWSDLLEADFSRQIEASAKQLVAVSLSRMVVADSALTQADKAKGISLIDVAGNERALTQKEIAQFSTLDDVKTRLLESHKHSKDGVDVAAAFASEMLQSNVSFDVQATDARRKKAEAGVNSVVIKIEEGEMIVRGGLRYDARHAMLLEGIRREKEKSSTPFRMLGSVILVALVIISCFYFGERYIKKFASARADLYFMGSILVVMLVMLRLGLSLSRIVYNAAGMEIPLVAFYYAMPVAAAAMIVRFILNSETALIFMIPAAIFSGVMVSGHANFTGYILVASIAAATSIAYADKRSAIIKAGAYTAAVSALAAISFQLVEAASLTESVTFINFFWYVLFAVAGGFFCSFIVTLITPLVEYVFGYTTDIKLLELANLNHPLLRELVIRAPGTYHHSHLVGILAEAASEAIGANPLLVRVAAYYHDIGKIRKPLYFVENTTDCESRHEKLSPNMSALIISSHVKDGLELAQQYKIPKRISDMIVQHHGTKMISFFYEKAKGLIASGSDVKIDEKDFRYAGPKPQTREAGILLLADAVEAAVRSLKEKSPSRIQQMVEDVINSSFVEAQLDECDLTLRNLHDIAASFTKILMGIYHQRIEYPKETFAAAEENK